MKSILVTGASTGIGRDIAEMLDKNGYRVFAGIRKEQDAVSIRASCSERVTPVMLDVADDTSIEKAFEVISQACGKNGMMGLVNNAGIAVPGALEFVSMEKVRWQMEVNYFGVLKVTQAFLPLIRRFAESGAHYGRIVNVGSIGGRNAFPFMGLYNASKFALVGLSESMRYELSPWSIHVSVLEPGAVTTPIWDKGKSDFDMAVETMSEKQKSFYLARMQSFKKLMLKTAEKGIPVEKVSKAALHALSAERPKNRYLIGIEAKMMAKLVRFLPEQWRFHLIRKQIGLGKEY